MDQYRQDRSSRAQSFARRSLSIGTVSDAAKSAV